MLNQGIIPRALHGLIEYGAAAVAFAAPFLLDFEDDAATAASIVAGVVLLLIAASTDGPTSLANSIPIGVHVVIDFLLAGLLIAAPFLFGFSDDSTPTIFFLAVGALHLLVTVGTRFRGREPDPEPADFVRRDDEPGAAG